MTPDFPKDHWLRQPKAVSAVLLAGLVLVLGRLWFQLLAPPLPDEAYYWLWGQRWDWSYFDHPPLQAWMQGAIAALGLEGRFALRVLPTALSTAAMLWALWQVIGAWRLTVRQGLAVMAVVMASPVMLTQTTLVFNDHLMLACLALGLAAAVKVLGALDDGAVPRPVQIHAVGLWLGLAILAKYNAALPALALVLLIVLRARYRVLLANPHLYGAMALGLACLFPIFWWNLTQGGESFEYNLSDRLRFDAGRMAGNALAFVAMGAVAFSVFLIPALWRVLRAPGTTAARVAVACFALSSLVWLGMTGLSFVLYYWNIVAYLLILPLAAMALRRASAALAHMALGCVLSIALALNYAHVPVSVLAGQAVDHETALTQGWDVLDERITALRAAHGAARQVASDYRYGSILAWWSGDIGTEVFSSRRSQFDIWQERGAEPQGPAIILTGTDYPMSPAIEARFARLTHLERHVITRAGVEVMTWDLWLGE